jgi:deazaflavin-dependent oxidoreductase (nitroreductase family)
MRTTAKTLVVTLGLVVVLWVVETAITGWAWRSRSPRALSVIKRFNKCVLNPVMLRFSGRSGLAAIVHHIGRRSKTPYATPVIAHQTHQGVIIPLPYGTEVDWLRNLIAAGEAVVELGGRSATVDEPAVVAIEDVIDFLPAPMVRIVHFNGAREVLRLHVSEPTAASL